MLNDQSDEKVFRDMDENAVGYSKFKEMVPMFFTRARAPLHIEGMYRGRACFLISNGPSLKNVDMNLLKHPGLCFMTVNNGPSTLLTNGITPTFWTCVDHPGRFVKQIWLNPAITKFVPVSAFEKGLWDNEEWKDLNMHVSACPNVVGFMRNEKFAAHRFFLESSFNWGCHRKFGGCRSVLLPAIRIPYILGFRRLYLIGVDMNMDPNNGYHFEEGCRRETIHGNQNTYKRFIAEYGPGMRKYAEPLGYNIYNCNPESALKCFEFCDLKEAIAKETAEMGPVDKIETKGMYLLPDEKRGKTRETAFGMTSGTIPK